MIPRRRFILISAAALALAGPSRAAPVHRWQGIALGAKATIRLSHPQAEAVTARAAAEIARLEDIFSLYRAGSALSVLNRQGHLDAPPFELLECLTIAGRVRDVSQGRFDPTVQPLWQAHAVAASAGRAITRAERDRALAVTGWDGVQVAPDRITLRPGMALTLNGIAQGYIADRVAALLGAEGLTDILIDTGELRALGGHPQGGDWPVRLADTGAAVPLRDGALATSAPRGTVLDDAGRVGHIRDPVTGQPAPPRWRSVTVGAESAALADGLSTAACLMPTRASILAMTGRIPQARLVRIVT